MFTKRVGKQCYIKVPRDSNVMPATWVREDWENLSDEQRQEILDQEAEEQEDDEDDD